MLHCGVMAPCINAQLVWAPTVSGIMVMITSIGIVSRVGTDGIIARATARLKSSSDVLHAKENVILVGWERPVGIVYNAGLHSLKTTKT